MEMNLNVIINETKKVSFVIPIYETEKYLKKCLESLLNQDYTNIEIICVADGKSRQAESIFNTLAKNDKRLVKYLTIQHSGAPKARNMGFPYTTGDYVSFWDSDCYAETGMVRMWIKMFEKHKEASFVYSGYRFNDENQSYIESETFNKYLLTCGNYIATMFPMKRDVFPGFDESLESLQDWDLWLTLAERGFTGAYLQGSAFTTEFRKGSISAVGCSRENWLERYNKVRNKHNIPTRHICFSSFVHKHEATALAEIFKQDFSNNLGNLPHEYKVIWAIGCYPDTIDNTVSVFQNAPKDCKKIMHWTGLDVENIFNMPYRIVKVIVELLNKVVYKHYVEYEISKNMLKELGIDAEVLLIPSVYKEIPLPKEFKVYYEHDNVTNEFIQSIIKACPDIKFESPDMCNLEDYASCIMISLCPVPSENLKKFLAAGRQVITNYRMPYCNFINIDDMNKAKSEVIEKLRKIKKIYSKGIINKEQVEYWKNEIYPNRMEKIIDDFKKS